MVFVEIRETDSKHSTPPSAVIFLLPRRKSEQQLKITPRREEKHENVHVSVVLRDPVGVVVCTKPNPPRRNITWHEGLSREERSTLRGHQGFTIWLTGLSASGKSTIATALEQHLLHNGVSAYRLDGTPPFLTPAPRKPPPANTAR